MQSSSEFQTAVYLVESHTVLQARAKGFDIYFNISSVLLKPFTNHAAPFLSTSLKHEMVLDEWGHSAPLSIRPTSSWGSAPYRTMLLKKEKKLFWEINYLVGILCRLILNQK